MSFQQVVGNRWGKQASVFLKSLMWKKKSVENVRESGLCPFALLGDFSEKPKPQLISFDFFGDFSEKSKPQLISFDLFGDFLEKSKL